MPGVAVPSFIPPLTPIAYYVGRVRAAYTRKVLVRSYLRKVRGRKARRRVNVYRLIEVPAVRSLSWHVQAPSIAFKWYNVAAYQEAIEHQKELDGFEVTERDAEIFHRSPAEDVIHAVEERRDNKPFYFGAPTLFVWIKPVLPVKLQLKTRIKKLRPYPFRMVRVWFWVYHTEKEEYRIWTRSTALEYNEAWPACWDIAYRLYEAVIKEFSESYTYLEARGIVAWTAYTSDEAKAPRRDKRAIEKESGGSE